jgi:DNA-directed RNA polymerase subunit RPC12/RpoP
MRVKTWSEHVDYMFDTCRDDLEYRQCMIEIGGLHEAVGRHYNDNEWRKWFKENVNK